MPKISELVTTGIKGLWGTETVSEGNGIPVIKQTIFLMKVLLIIAILHIEIYHLTKLVKTFCKAEIFSLKKVAEQKRIL